MKSIRECSIDAEQKPTFLNDHELKHMILEAGNGFLFVVDCHTGRVIYVADSMESVLNLKQVRDHS